MRYRSTRGNLPHTPATAEEASDTVSRACESSGARRTKPGAAHRSLPATNSLNRVCLEDRPGVSISFTGHDAQPKTGTTPAPLKATVNDDHPASTGGVLKRYKPEICSLRASSHHGRVHSEAAFDGPPGRLSDPRVLAVTPRGTGSTATATDS